MTGHGVFNGQIEDHSFDGFLFDLDGTIINTTEAITKHWEKSVSAYSFSANNDSNLIALQLQEYTNRVNQTWR